MYNLYSKLKENNVDLSLDKQLDESLKPLGPFSHIFRTTSENIPILKLTDAVKQCCLQRLLSAQKYILTNLSHSFHHLHSL